MMILVQINVYVRNMWKERTVTDVSLDSTIYKRGIQRAALNVSALVFLMSVMNSFGIPLRCLISMVGMSVTCMDLREFTHNKTCLMVLIK
ncbi:unnamed protein product [Staurois parvus]|uniref:Uncharacterized protein n=1 Tax=Staurois parvus TaxID=386267 RepID=A0ABN9FY27_9NEOB|nr:unnamed protein product [Staurois parvus]